MNYKLKIPFRIIVLVIISLTALNVSAEDLKTLVNLEGNWQFSIGDNPEWSKPEYDDSKWDKMYVPSSWNNEGLADYNGYAWYRKHFMFDKIDDSEYVLLILGYIDDADEVYLNGKLIGSRGRMLPDPQTAYTYERKYPVPVSLLNKYGKNTLAVRVYDYDNDGGIVSGNIGLFTDRQSSYLAVDLSGYWGFETETEMKHRIKNNLARSDNKIYVPADWESQGYNDFDGKARYNIQFKISQALKGEDLYLILGFVDDVETVYINKTKIGSVFSLEEEEDTKLPYELIFRGYKIPPKVLKFNEYNYLSVMVYDKGGIGGIYKGPIGIATKVNYNKLKSLNTIERGFWDNFIDNY